MAVTSLMPMATLHVQCSWSPDVAAGRQPYIQLPQDSSVQDVVRAANCFNIMHRLLRITEHLSLLSCALGCIRLRWDGSG